MREQEPVISQFIDLLIDRLHNVCSNGKEVVDIVSWFNVSCHTLVFNLPIDKVVIMVQ